MMEGNVSDVWVDRLFRVRGQVQIGPVTIYLRTLTAVDESDKLTFSLAESRRILSNLTDGKSDEAKRFKDYLDSATIESLRRDAILGRRRELRREAEYMVKQESSPEPPKRAKVRDVVKAKLDEERIIAETENKRVQWVEEMSKAFENTIETMSRENVVKMAEKAMLDLRVDQSFSVSSDTFTVYSACFKDQDCKERYFADVEEVKQIGDAAMRTILEEYRRVDAFSSDPEALKNLPYCPPSTDS